MTIIPIVICTLSTVTKRLTGGIGNKWTSGDHPNYGIVEICQNTEKCPGDLRRLVVIEAPANPDVKNSQRVKITKR